MTRTRSAGACQPPARKAFRPAVGRSRETLLRRVTMSGSSKSIVVIGGGVIGLSVAYYAQRCGHRVTIIERGARDHDSCSRGNCGMVVPSHFIPLAAPGMVGLGLRMMCNPESPFTIQARPSWDLLL